MAILEIKNLSLTMDGKQLLQNVNLSFNEGKVHAVVGTNGAGKSTLSYTIMGLSEYRDFEGDIIFDGTSLKDLSIDERARLGITLGWQEPARYEGLKVSDFILASTQKKDKDVVNRVLEQVGLNPATYAPRAVDKTLSGGERKRIELASLLAMEPRFLILDEPDSGIDVAALVMIFSALEYLKEKGTTILLITHSMTVLEKAEHAFLLCHGTVQDEGSVKSISAYFGKKCLPCVHKNDPEKDEAAQ